MERLKTGGRVATLTRAQALQARQWMDEGTTMTDAARKLAVSRAALNRSLIREGLTNRDKQTEIAAMQAELERLRSKRDMQAEVAAMKLELERLRSWRDMMLASAPSATGEKVSA